MQRHAQWMPNVYSPTEGRAVTFSDSLSTGQVSPATSCFHQQISEGHLAPTHRATGSVPISLEPIWRFQEGQVQVSQPMMWLHRHSKGVKTPVNSSSCKRNSHLLCRASERHRRHERKLAATLKKWVRKKLQVIIRPIPQGLRNTSI